MTKNTDILSNNTSASNYQDLLKVIALLCMLLDHAGLYLMPEDVWFRIIGRSVMPIFAFYAGYNFHYKIRHMVWICGVILTVACATFIGLIGPANMLISIAVGQVYLLYAGKAIIQYQQRFFRHFMGMIILGIVTYGVFEYGTLTIAFMQVGYLRANGYKDPGYILLAGLSLAVLHQYVWNFETIVQFIGALFAVLASVSLLQYVPHNEKLKLNLKPISRNMLYIYTVTTLSYMVLWSMPANLTPLSLFSLN